MGPRDVWMGQEAKPGVAQGEGPFSHRKVKKNRASHWGGVRYFFGNHCHMSGGSVFIAPGLGTLWGRANRGSGSGLSERDMGDELDVPHRKALLFSNV